MSESQEPNTSEGIENSTVTSRLLERQIGGLALSELEGVGSMALMRAVAWHNVLVRLGMAIPLVVVHDVGCLLTGLGRQEAWCAGWGTLEWRRAGGVSW